MTNSRRALIASAILFSASAGCGPATADQSSRSTLPAVDVIPPAPQLAPGGRLGFTAAVAGSAVAVTWTVQETGGGSITTGGLYTAPTAAGQYHVIATTASSPSMSGSAIVTVTPTPVVQVTVSPRAPSVVAGGSIAFSATVTGSANTDVRWTVQEGPAGGAISSTGAYMAPSTPGTYHVVATSVADGTKNDTATVTVTAPLRVSVAISPRTPSVPAGGQIAFTAAVLNTADARVTWSVAEAAGCGSVNGSGVYTAPAAAATCHVVATSVADGSQIDTATVTVTAGASTLADQLAILAGKAIYFGHQSVGRNIMSDAYDGSTTLGGVRALLDVNPGTEPTVTYTNGAAAMGKGIWAEYDNGTNYYPDQKIAEFKATMDAGAGPKLDLAFFKFCWVDFDDSDWFATQNKTVQQLFDLYRSTMAGLKAAYPSVKFVHFTAPIWSDDVPYNQRRETYNNLIRSTYGGKEPVFDLALMESTDPGGNRVMGAYGPRLYAGYTDDGGHLNATGRDKAARALIAFLAGL